MKKTRLLAALLAGVMALSLTACGSTEEDTTAPAGEDTSAAQESTAGGQSFDVGICQQMQHESLDAATQGFQDKLTELMEADGNTVNFDLQNASGDSANCTTIINGFVSAGDDLIMANGTAALQAAQSGTADIPILGTSITDYATALDMSDWTGKTGTNISGTTDLAPLDGQAEMLQEVFPDAKNVGLLYCSAEPNSAYQINVIKPILEEMGYTCTEYTFAPIPMISHRSPPMRAQRAMSSTSRPTTPPPPAPRPSATWSSRQASRLLPALRASARAAASLPCASTTTSSAR